MHTYVPLKCSNIYDLLRDEDEETIDQNRGELVLKSQDKIINSQYHSLLAHSQGRPMQIDQMRILSGGDSLKIRPMFNDDCENEDDDDDDDDDDESESEENKDYGDYKDYEDSDSDDEESKRAINIDIVNIGVPLFLKIYGNYHEARKTRFEYDSNGFNGIGSGADKHCRTTMIQRIIDFYFNKIDNWFMEPKWELYDKTIFEQIMNFFRSCIKLKILLPLHFSPRVIETLTQKTMERDELMYFLEYIDPEIHKYVSRLDETFKYCKKTFKSLNTGHESLDHMIRERIIPKKLTKSEIKKTRSLDLGPLIYDGLIDLDKIISEPYVFTDEMITKIFTVKKSYYNKIEYQKMWIQMIIGMTNEEKRAMVILFTGSSAIDGVKVNIHVNTFDHVAENKQCDIEIHACESSGTINEKMFLSQETLNGLRYYFSDANDVVNDQLN